MTNLISIDATELLNVAQQLEARCDPAVVAQEMRKLVAAAKPATATDLVADMRLEILFFGQCRGPIHTKSKEPCDCRHCSILRRISLTTHNHGNKS